MVCAPPWVAAATTTASARNPPRLDSASHPRSARHASHLGPAPCCMESDSDAPTIRHTRRAPGPHRPSRGPTTRPFVPPGHPHHSSDLAPTRRQYQNPLPPQQPSFGATRSCCKPSWATTQLPRPGAECPRAQRRRGILARGQVPHPHTTVPSGYWRSPGHSIGRPAKSPRHLHAWGFLKETRPASLTCWCGCPPPRLPRGGSWHDLPWCRCLPPAGLRPCLRCRHGCFRCPCSPDRP